MHSKSRDPAENLKGLPPAETKNLDTQVPICREQNCSSVAWECLCLNHIDSDSIEQYAFVQLKQPSLKISSLNIYLRLNATALYQIVFVNLLTIRLGHISFIQVSFGKDLNAIFGLI